MSIDDKLDKLDTAVTMAANEISALRLDLIGRDKTVNKIKDEIEREGDYFNAEVNADIAQGLYYALEIIKKHYTY